MKPDLALAATLVAVCSLALTAQAAPPEGKGPGNSAGNPGMGGNGGQGKGSNASPGASSMREYEADRRYGDVRLF